jgi:signal peptidase I
MTVVQNWKPKPWIAVLLSIVVAPLGLVYAGRPRWAGIFFVATTSIAIAAFFRAFDWASDEVMVVLQIAAVIVGIVLAYRVAKTAPERIRPRYTRWYGLLAIFGVVAVATVVFRAFVYEPFKIPSTAMAPTAELGTRIIVQKFGYGHFSSYGMRFASRPISAPLHRGDVIVFDYPVDPAETYIKRIVGVPGDRVVYRDKHLFVNGVDTRVRQLDDYLHPDLPRYSQRFLDKLDGTTFATLQDDVQRQPEPSNFAFRDHCAYTENEVRCDVPAGNYFVMGDNRDNSLDSRYWGFVRSDLIIGKVVRIIH